MIDILIGLAITVIGSYVGSVEWRLRTMDERLRKAVGKDDILELIDLKQESLEVLQRELKEDIKNLDDKLDRILERQYKD